jgi:alkanesulfonate monooxygenase SsuD/methylene tetrahydromethanopterin reductase-like flavin-dependent oxidoreductase (luciferase family)
MLYGISIPPFGDYADARVLADLAREAEAAEWDGFFLWDHMIFDPSGHAIADPWTALAAVAMRTERMRIGTLITPVARRRPWKLARETVTLDRLSGGRLTLGVGLGDPARWDFGFFGEDEDPRVRAARLDEGLEVLAGLWRGEPFSHQGDHYQVQAVRFQPRAAQQPRIPVWVGGAWPHRRPARRAARWDGFFPISFGDPITPNTWRAILAYIALHRESSAPFDAVQSGATDGADRARAAEMVAPYADVGVTWWMEDVSPYRFGRRWEDPWTAHDERLMAERVRQGPPRV